MFHIPDDTALITMSEYWKSTPKYLCKYCNVYVRDTKLERNNHESTGKHQGALKRFLRDLHRSHDQGEREKERAQREVERLNGLVGGASSSKAGGGGSSSSGSSAARSAAPPKLSIEQERKRQIEQLAGLGVAIPSALQPDMAIAGEWTVTATRIIPDTPAGADDKKKTTVEATALGVSKRKVTEEEKEEEEAVSRLFKKRRKWGVDSKMMPSENKELDALLAGDLFGTSKAKPEAAEPAPAPAKAKVKEPVVKQEAGPVVKEEENPAIKTEDDAEPIKERASADVKVKSEPVE